MTPVELDELRSRVGNSCAEVALRLGCRPRPHGREMMGACPICSTDLQSRTATKWQTKDGGRSWVCAACPDGGDCIRLVEKALGLDFKAAIEWLGGIHTVDREADEVRQKAKQIDEAKKAAEAEKYRERERAALYEVWRRALDPRGTPVETYLNNRAISVPPWPEGVARLRSVPDMAFIDGTITDEAGRRSANLIHRGPAMVAPITRQGRFSGLHITYLDEGGAKLEIFDQATGEALPAKKVRGSKAGSEIKLITCASDKPVERIVIGEGIETVLSVWCALVACEIDLTTTEFWSAIDLGNLGGKASAQIVHPTLRTAAGGPRRVPGPDPDLSSPAIVIPDSVSEVIILGDSDSDRVTTQCAIHRAAERFRAARADRVVRAAFPDCGMDFGGMLAMTG